MTADPKTVATTYFTAWKAKDFDTLRSLLADEVTFRGSLGTADGIDECLRGLEGIGHMITDIVIQQIFVEGNDVLTWYDLHTNKADPVPTANWSHLEGGKITAIRAAFDPRPLIADAG
jgi:ketosteroid isomerase-like protein